MIHKEELYRHTNINPSQITQLAVYMIDIEVKSKGINKFQKLEASEMNSFLYGLAWKNVFEYVLKPISKTASKGNC